jgi:O-antigen ligase
MYAGLKGGVKSFREMAGNRAPRAGGRGSQGPQRAASRAASPQTAPGMQAPRPRGSATLMVVAALLLVLHLGRPFDYVLSGFHLPAIICGIALIAGVLGGGLLILKSRVGLPLLALIGWMALITPFSHWKGGSANYLAGYSFFMVGVLLVVAAAPRSLRDVKRLFVVAALAPTLIVLLASIPTEALWNVPEGTQGPVRMRLESGMYSNSADLALIAGFAIPFWLFLCSQFRFPVLQIPLAVMATIFLARSVLLSGTRSALLAGAGMFAVYFLFGGLPKKVLMVLLAVVAIASVPLILPGHITQRLGTLFDLLTSEASEDTSSEAALSAQMRRELLKDSIRYTLKYPLTGVGPGQFADYRWNEEVTEGIPKTYYVAHNTYTQISSECGIPGFICFLALLWGVCRTVKNANKTSSRDSHPDWRQVTAMRTCLIAAFVYYAICAFFMTLPAYVHPVLLGSLALALERTNCLAAEQAKPTAQQPAPGGGLPAWKFAKASGRARSA